MFLQWYQRTQCNHFFTYTEATTKNKKKFPWVNSHNVLLFKLNSKRSEPLKCSKLYFWYLFFFTTLQPKIQKFKIFKKHRKFLIWKKRFLMHFVIKLLQGYFTNKTMNCFHFWLEQVRAFPQHNLKVLSWQTHGLYYLTYDRPSINNWNFDFLHMRPILFIKTTKNFFSRSYLNYIRFHNLCQFSKNFTNKH